MKWTLTRGRLRAAVTVLAVLEAVVLIHFLGWITPPSERGDPELNRMIELERELADVRGMIEQEDLLRTGLDRGIARLESLAEFLPASPDRYAWSYEFVLRCAGQARITLDTVEELMIAPGALVQPYAIHIACRCDYNRLVEFIWRLETANPLLRVKTVAIAPAQGISMAHRVQIVIQWLIPQKIERV